MAAKREGKFPCRLPYCQQYVGLRGLGEVLEKEGHARVEGVPSGVLNEIYEHYFCATSGIANSCKIGNLTFHPPEKGMVKVVFDNGHTYHISLDPKNVK